MDIKEYLKPTKNKSILFILLFLFFPVIFPWLTDNCPKYEYALRTDVEPCDDIAIRVSVGFVFNAILDEFQRTPRWILSHFEIRGLPPKHYPEYYLYHITITYLLACLLLPIHYRTKDRTEKLLRKILKRLEPLPPWLKGGATSSIILLLLILWRSFKNNYSVETISFIITPIRPIVDYFSETKIVIISPLLVLIYFFLIGAIIGSIVHKITKKNKIDK